MGRWWGLGILSPCFRGHCFPHIKNWNLPALQIKTGESYLFVKFRPDSDQKWASSYFTSLNFPGDVCACAKFSETMHKIREADKRILVRALPTQEGNLVVIWAGHKIQSTLFFFFYFLWAMNLLVLVGRKKKNCMKVELPLYLVFKDNFWSHIFFWNWEMGRVNKNSIRNCILLALWLRRRGVVFSGKREKWLIFG